MSSEIQLINQGTYGCVFHPGVKCDGKIETAKYVTKIQRNERTITNEWEISQKIRGISGYTKYFVPILKKCDVKIKKDNADNLRECKVFKDQSDEEIAKSSYVSMKIRYVGDVTLRGRVFSVPIDDFVPELLKTHAHILNGLQKLVNNGIVHNDLRSNNIMYDMTTKTQRPLIIDFGLAFSKDKLLPRNLDQIFYVFESYSYWCIEVVACSYIFKVIGYQKAKTQTVTKQELAVIYDVFMHGTEKRLDEAGNTKIENEAYELHVLTRPEKIKQFHAIYDTYFGKFVGKTWLSMYKELIKFAHTWDNYSMAVIYLLLLDDAYEGNIENYNQIIGQHSAETKQYIELLEDIVYSSPDKRPTLNDAINRIPKLELTRPA